MVIVIDNLRVYVNKQILAAIKEAILFIIYCRTYRILIQLNLYGPS